MSSQDSSDKPRIELQNMNDDHAEMVREILVDGGVKESAITRDES